MIALGMRVLLLGYGPEFFRGGGVGVNTKGGQGRGGAAHTKFYTLKKTQLSPDECHFVKCC